MAQLRGKVQLGISNRHIHLTTEHLSTLFGEGYDLTKIKDLSQPGQFACDETVIIVGRKGAIPGVRVLGPIRKETQVEISRTDSFALGVRPPIRDSGQLDGSPGIVVVGPKGAINLNKGVIIAKRHIHMTPKDAANFGVEDKQIVTVKVGGDRALTFDEVLIRVRDDFSLELHLDTDEANAAAVSNGDWAEVY
ncbi:MAG: phosphate propanoyltransferase [Limnochordia bacterium]|nr:phosphate propanoyltransferase [Limnochordia bacterium]MDD4518752.1 phosphate propanoyltransferase [Limnochordia bacterium]